MRKQKYDVAIIGGGIGGLAAAALLSKDGYRTVVMEKMPQVGGRFSNIDYKGFKLTTGALVIETGGVIEQTFHEVGAEFDVQPTTDYRYRVAGHDYEFRKGAVRGLLSLVCEEEAEVDKIMGHFRRAVQWMEPTRSLTLHEWLCQYTNNLRVLHLFRALAEINQSINSNALPAGELFRFFAEQGGFNSFGIACQGNSALMESLARVIQAKGGQIWSSCQAKYIVVDDGIAKGVIAKTEKGEIQIEADVVISDVGSTKTVELAGRDNFERGYLRELKEMMKPVPIILIHTISDRPLIDHVSINLIDTDRIRYVLCPTLVCPELAPPGKHLMTSGGGPLSSLFISSLKKEIELHIQELNEVIPGFKENGEILTINTFVGEWPGFGTYPGFNMPQKTPIVNLYNVGDSVGPSGYIAGPACVLSARMVVEDMKRRVK